MILFLLFILLSLYGWGVYFWIKKKHALFLSVILLLMLLYDWLFISLSYYFSSSFVFVLKSYQEIILLLIILLCLSRIISLREAVFDKFDRMFVICIIIPFFFLFFLSLFNKDSLDLIVKGIRSFFLPVFFAYLFYKQKLLYLDFRIIGLLLVLAVGFAAFQSFSFEGNLNDLWFYRNYELSGLANPVDEGAFNFIKEDMLRATSFFVTPIDLSILSALLSSFFVSRLFAHFRLLDLCMAFIGFGGIYLSQTRMGWFVCSINILIFLKLKFQRNLQIRRRYILLLPFIAIITTFVSLISGAITDLSAAGRLIQYAEFIDGVNLLGAGIGDYQAIFSYDSFFLCTLRMMGLWGILYFLFYFKLLNYIVVCFNKCNYTSWRPNEIFIIANSSSVIYVFAFHHIAGSIVQSYIYVLLFYGLSTYQALVESRKVKVLF